MQGNSGVGTAVKTVARACVQSGCEGEQFKEVTRSGEYIVVCKTSEDWQPQ